MSCAERTLQGAGCRDFQPDADASASPASPTRRCCRSCSSRPGWALAEAGWLAALNYAGYLSGALIASLISDLVLKDRLYRIGLVVAIVSTAMMGLTNDFPWLWMLSRFIAGLSSAAGMLLGTGLILNWLIRHNHRPRAGHPLFRHRARHRRLLGGRLADGRHAGLARAVVRLHGAGLPAHRAGPGLAAGAGHQPG